MKLILRDGHLEDVLVGVRSDVPPVTCDGLFAQRGDSKTKLIDTEFGLSDGLLPGREVRRDEAYQRKAAEKVLSEIMIVPVDLMKAPMQESRVPSLRAGSIEDLTDVKWSSCQPGG